MKPGKFRFIYKPRELHNHTSRLNLLPMFVFPEFVIRSKIEEEKIIYSDLNAADCIKQ